MKKYQYIVAAACLLVGTFGFAGIYATDQAEQKKQAKEQVVQQQQEIEAPQTVEDDNNSIVDLGETSNSDGPIINETNMEPEVAEQDVQPEGNEENVEETPVGTVTQETLHFNPEYVMWPVEGSVLLDYSMDSTIFFPTLQQYQYHPAMVLSGEVNDKVYFVAKGKIVNIETNEVTGCTVTQDLGDGYTAIYGQLKELNFEVGDMVDSGQVVGYISEPTKYYAVEGSNVYFQLLKDGLPVDPEEILP